MEFKVDNDLFGVKQSKVKSQVKDGVVGTKRVKKPGKKVVLQVSSSSSDSSNDSSSSDESSSSESSSSSDSDDDQKKSKNSKNRRKIKEKEKQKEKVKKIDKQSMVKKIAKEFNQ